jgi:4-hydroxy-tetrahydrodipicolinate synthase
MFKGSFVAVITPFQENGDLDLDTLKKLVQWQVESGTDAILCCGSTGEDPTLSDEERVLVIQTVLEAVGKRVPVIAGTGTNNTRTTVERTRQAKELGVDAVLVMIPYYNRPTFEGCVAHFTEVGKAELSTIIYYHPGRTGVRLTAEELAALVDLPNMAAIKDCSNSLDFLDELKLYTDKPILSGVDCLALEQLNKRAAGVISVVANVIPGQWKEMIDLCLKGDFVKAGEIFKTLLPLCKALEIETNPHGVKYAMHLIGKSRPDLRLPLVQPREATKLAIEQALSDWKILV